MKASLLVSHIALLIFSKPFSVGFNLSIKFELQMKEINVAYLQFSLADCFNGIYEFLETAMPSFKKTDRVEFTNKGSTIYGIVRKGGASKCEVVQDGAKSVFTVPVSLLKFSTKPLPTQPEHPMDAWGLKKYAASKLNSRGTVCFTAEITHNGKTVIHAQNDGNGGADRYYSATGRYEVVAQFEADAKQWIIDHGMPEAHAIEPANIWISWKAEHAPYAGSATDYIAEWKEALGIEDEAPSMKM